MSCDFQANDRDKVPVRCRHDTWESHITDEHLEMLEQQGAVITTVRDPVYVYQSARYARRRLFYRPFVLSGAFNRFYLLVVVQYKGNGRNTTGEIVTAYSTANIKEGDALIWSKYETKGS